MDTLLELNHTLFMTNRALTEGALHLQVQIETGRSRIGMLSQFTTALKLISISTKSNQIATAVATNYVFAVNHYAHINYYGWSVQYTKWNRIENNEKIICRCGQTTCIAPAGFTSFANIDNLTVYGELQIDLSNITDELPGFFLSCTPLEAILQANLLCLYDMDCIKVLLPYFPPLEQVCFSFHFTFTSKHFQSLEQTLHVSKDSHNMIHLF